MTNTRTKRGIAVALASLAALALAACSSSESPTSAAPTGTSQTATAQFPGPVQRSNTLLVSAVNGVVESLPLSAFTKT